MSDPLELEHCAKLLSALAAPERLTIVRCLRKGALSVSELSARLQITLANVSHHLSVLRRARLVQTRKQGRYVLYSLAQACSRRTTPRAASRINLGCCWLAWPPPSPGAPLTPA